MSNTNNYCDGDSCQHPNGEVRLLPLGGGANLILCLVCFGREMVYRRQRNKELGSACQFETPNWGDLEVYKP